jgi:DNA adenine methylase
MQSGQTTKIRSAIKCFGGKYYLASWIIKHFPSNYTNMCFIEPFGGGGNVILQKQPSVVLDIWCDKNPKIFNVFYCIKYYFDEFYKAVSSYRCDNKTFEWALETSRKIDHNSEYFLSGVTEFILRNMSIAGRGLSFSFSSRSRGGQPEHVNAWTTKVQLLPQIHHRIKNISLRNGDYFEPLEQYNVNNCLVYCDPPYYGKKYYDEYSMTEEDHKALLNCLLYFRGHVIISNYDNPLYDKILSQNGWQKYQKVIANHASHKKQKNRNIETIWCNFGL